MTEPARVPVQVAPEDVREGDLLELRGEQTPVTAVDTETDAAHVLITAGDGTGAYVRDVAVVVHRVPDAPREEPAGELGTVRDLALALADVVDRGQIGSAKDRETIRDTADRVRRQR